MAFAWIKEIRASFARSSAQPLTPDQEQQLFFRALRDKDLETVRKLAGKYSQETLSWKSGNQSPLQVAQKSGNLEAFKFLVEMGANADEAGAEGWTPLLLAVKKKQKDFADYLLDKGVKLDAVAITSDRRRGGFANPFDYGTAMHIALANGDREMMVRLIERGAPADIKTEIGANQWSPEEYAHWCGKEKLISVIQDAPAIRANYLAARERDRQRLEQLYQEASTEYPIQIMSPLRLRRRETR